MHIPAATVAPESLMANLAICGISFCFSITKGVVGLTLIIASSVLCLLIIEWAMVFSSDRDNNEIDSAKQFHEKHVQYNSHGYRDYDYSLKKSNDVFRVIVLGDSQTFGSGIKNLNDIWVKKLEAKLKEERNGSKIEILNISGPGWNTDTQLYELFKHGLSFNPDLVVLAYYHNDIPTNTYFSCDSTDYKIAPDINLLHNSKLVNFLNFRVNRLLEKLWNKPSYPDCLAQTYDSISWEMEKFYLDTMARTLAIKKIHFLITVIPLIYKLDNNYPLKKAHQYLKEFSNQRSIEFLDLYERGFKNLDADILRISESDHHLNLEANTIVADTLFNKIKALTKYKNISYFNKAFSLKEFLEEKQILKEIDTLFNKKETIANFNFDSENESFEITRKTDNFIFKKFKKKLNHANSFSLLETTLSSNGGFQSLKKVVFYPDTKIPKIIDSIVNKSGTYKQTIEQLVSNSKGSFTRHQLGQTIYEFKYEIFSNDFRIKLTRDTVFPDPKLLDKWIFQNIQPPSKKISIEKQKEALVWLITNNSNIYNSDSHFFEVLKSYPWIPDKQKKMQMPEDLDERNIDDKFYKIASNSKTPWLKNIGFASKSETFSHALKQQYENLPTQKVTKLLQAANYNASQLQLPEP